MTPGEPEELIFPGPGGKAYPQIPHTVKSILGHSTITLTERNSHLADTALKEAATKMPSLTTTAQADH
jgi:hypothetical protein